MSWWRPISINVEEILELKKRLDEGRLQPGDHELVSKMVKDTIRLRRQLWWQGHAQRLLFGMLAAVNWLRRCRGKPPLVPEEWDEDG
jgi:hypothetical protein